MYKIHEKLINIGFLLKGRFNITMMLILPRLVQNSNLITVKVSKIYFCPLDNMHSKVHANKQALDERQDEVGRKRKILKMKSNERFFSPTSS